MTPAAIKKEQPPLARLKNLFLSHLFSNAPNASPFALSSPCMTCVIVDAETPAGIASAATATPSMSNFLKVNPFRSRAPLCLQTLACAPRCQRRAGFAIASRADDTPLLLERLQLAHALGCAHSESSH